MRFSILTLIIAALCGCVSAPAQSAPRDANAVEVMVLGTWHFAGSSADVISASTDSVLSPARQADLEAVAARLAAFKPTVIVTERVTEAPRYIDPKFAEFSEKDLATNENERAQIAYRLAKTAGVTRVYGIDEQPAEGEPDYFPFDRVLDHANAVGRKAEIEAMIAATQAMVETEMARFSSMTIADALIETNTGALSAPDFYYDLLTYDEGEAQPGAELNAYWFMRNAKLFSKLIDVVKPGDRVIIVYGAGHKFWLDHLTEMTPGFVRIDPVDYLK
ncbi:MAG: DUF5694 domain-containing protein [Parvularculaceae bacterium]